MRGWFAGLCLLALTLVIGGCAALIDEDAVRICRSMTRAFSGSDVAVDLIRVEASRTAHGTMVTVAYNATPRQGPRERRAVSCILDRDSTVRGGWRIKSLATEEGPLGDVRLHLLHRHWIERGLAAGADPSPVVILGPMFDLPRGLAMALQLSFASLPGIAIYATLAAAYALLYGLVGRINLAFGELAMMAGYGAFLGFASIGEGAPLGFALLAAVALGLYTAATQGAALARFVVAPLVSRPGQHILIASIGLALFWSELVRLTQGSGGRWMSPVLSRPIGVARADDYIVTVSGMGLVVPLVGWAAVAATLALLRRSRFGRQWQACADDTFAAALLGIDAGRVLRLTMLLAATLAGLAGVLTALTYGGVGHAGGLVIGLKALIAAVLGGIGSVRAAVMGALLLGLGEAAWSGLFRIEYRDAALFAALALLLALKPEGLFAQAPSARPSSGTITTGHDERGRYSAPPQSAGTNDR